MQYLLESAICLAFFYGFYHLVLRRETFFQINRWYLLLAPLVACAVPALNIRLEAPVPVTVNSNPAEVEPELAVYELPIVVERLQVAPRTIRQVLDRPVWTLKLGTVIWWFYWGVAGFFLLRLLRNVLKMGFFIQRCQRHARGSIVLATGPSDTPMASFFGFVFWHPGDAADHERMLMFEHEMVHVRQWHTLDLILIELLIALQWFNPLLYVYRRSLREIHEYIADEYVVRRTRQRYAYATLLVRVQTTGNGAQPGLVNTFHSLIKNRLIMLAKHPSKPAHRAKYLLVIPLFAVLMLLFSFRLVENLPGAEPLLDAVQSLDNYRAELSEVIIAADRSDNTESTPYIFYWGAVQAKFLYNATSREYFAEMHIAPEEFREAIKREPRLWTGETLLQHLSLNLNELAVKSDYYQPKLYKSHQPAIAAMAANLKSGEYFKISNITLPEDRIGEVHVFLDGGTPGWLPQNQAPITLSADPAEQSVITNVYFGEERFIHGEERFVSVDEFWKITNAQPRITYLGEPDRSPEKWNLAIFKEQGPIHRAYANQEDALSLDQLREKLQEEKDNIKPGVKVWISAWDALSNEKARADADTIITFDPVTFEEKITVVRHDGQYTIRSFASELLTLRIVGDTDPRRFLKPIDKKRFDFEWGAFTYHLPNTVYALSYEETGSKNRIYADAILDHTNASFTKSDILEMLRLPAQLYRENEILENHSFTFNFKGQTWVINNGAVPEDLLKKLERDLQPGDIISIKGIQAKSNGSRQIVCTRKGIQQFKGKFNANEIKEFRLPGDDKLWHIDLQPEDFNHLKNQLENTPGIWFQYGDVDLSRLTINLEIRSEDPKPPLRPVHGTQNDNGINISVNPNPVHEKAVVSLDLPQAGKGTLSVTDMSGKMRASIETDFPKGPLPFNLPMNLYKLTPGVYIVKIAMPYGSASCKMTVQ